MQLIVKAQQELQELQVQLAQREQQDLRALQVHKVHRAQQELLVQQVHKVHQAQQVLQEQLEQHVGILMEMEHWMQVRIRMVMALVMD